MDQPGIDALIGATAPPQRHLSAFVTIAESFDPGA
jgi:hypothetical protein